MKKISVLTIFFLITSFCSPPDSRSNAAAIIPIAIIGTVVLTAGATQYALHKDHSSSDYQSDGYSIATPIIAFTKVHQAGKDIAIGKASKAVLDTKKAYESGVLQEYYPNLWRQIKDKLSPPFDPDAPAPGDVIDKSMYGCSGIGEVYSVSVLANQLRPKPQNDYCSGATIYHWKIQDKPEAAPGYAYYTRTQIIAYPSDKPVTYPPPPLPDTLPPSAVPGVNDHIAKGLPANPGIAQDLDNLLKNRPDLWRMPAEDAMPLNPNDITDYPLANPITVPDLKSFASGEKAEAQAQLIEALSGLVAANPDNAELKAELEKALADQAIQQAEEIEEQADEPTFSGINDSPFSEPYSPGEFDIGKRFSDFIDRIKSTGLFSFSNGFFSSLPSGGSSVYEINGGSTFGRHSVDLSQTMNSGLAILKAIFLCIFGFLSIRVVVLKR